jgi:hypothetical protein
MRKYSMLPAAPVSASWNPKPHARTI